MKAIGTLFIFAFLISCQAFAQGPSLTIKVRGLSELGGRLMVGVFNNDADFKNKVNPCKKAIIPINDTTISLTFDGIEPGTYAIGIYHDTNSDGQLNTKKLGIPAEGVGFSGGTPYRIRPLSFDEARFEFVKDTVCEIQMIYPKKQHNNTDH